MKISIGVNGYKKYEDLEKRERFCIQSLQKCKTDNIQLYNVCYKDENIQYKDFNTLNNLEKKSNKVIFDYFQHEGLVKEYFSRKSEIDNNKKEIPSVKEIFDTLASTDCDYFLFLNNDIILSNRLFKKIDKDVECYAISRMHIFDIETLNDTPKLESYSIHGFDAFLVKKETWLRVRNNFPDLILGRFYWDTFYATLFKLITNTVFLNELPPVCFHIEHSSTSSQDTIENYYNEDVFKRVLVVSHFWFTYVQNILLKRQTHNSCKWYYPVPQEKQIETQFFNQFNQNLCYNKNFTQLNVTSSKKYDLFIPCAPKDEIKLRYVVKYALENLSPNNVYICSPHSITNRLNDSKIIYINDKDVLDIPDKGFITFRPNWTYQQFLKMFFNLGESEYYFALDADTVITKKIPLFEDEHPIWYYGWEQNNLPYFLFNKKFFNLEKSLPHTGIGDLGLFNSQVTKSFLNFTNSESCKELLYKIGDKTSVFFHFSEYETYSNFTNEYYKDLYVYRHLEQQNCGKDLNQGENWTIADIEQTIEKYKNSTKSIVSLHSWKI